MCKICFAALILTSSFALGAGYLTWEYFATAKQLQDKYNQLQFSEEDLRTRLLASEELIKSTNSRFAEIVSRYTALEKEHETLIEESQMQLIKIASLEEKVLAHEKGFKSMYKRDD